ncbi:hypothetical protein OROGR_018519 [Orobanche gracilis]
MFSKINSRRKDGENSGTGKFTNDLEIISKAICIDKTLPRLASSTASSRSKSVGKSYLPESKSKQKDAKSNSAKDSPDREKKPSIWSWKGLKALTNIRNHRFNCCFSLLVHSVEGLPPIFDDVCLVVHWRRRDGEQMTRPVRVYQGVAQVEEQLTHSCSVYGTRSGPHHSAKYEAKHFLLYASVYNAHELDLGKHRVDMTRLLPLTLEELENEKSSGKWTTSFNLSGKARGATMNVSFGYVVIGNNDNINRSVPESPRLGQDRDKIVKIMGQFDMTDELSIIRRVESLPARLSTLNQPSEDIKDLHEVLPVPGPEMNESGNVLYKSLDEENSNTSVEDVLDFPRADSLKKQDSFTQPDAVERITETEWDTSELSVVNKGIDEFDKEQLKLEENISEVGRTSEEVLETDGAVEETGTVLRKDKQFTGTCNSKDKENGISSKESLMKDLETALSYAKDSVNEGADSQEDETDAIFREQEDSLIIVNSCCGDHKREKLLVSLDDITNTVANDFLDMLGLEHSPVELSSKSEPESPRERLLKQFEKDATANGGLFHLDIENDPNDATENGVLLDLDIENDPADIVWEAISNNLHQSPPTHEVFHEMPNLETITPTTKTRASTLEDLESKALMRDWGLNEEAFRHSPPSDGDEFGSQVDVAPNEVHRLPQLAEGLGPFVRTKNGGFLRSMNPALFMSARNGGSLIMQVSSPVVVPAEMGSGVMDILQCLASLGIEKLSMQANRLMPLEDITGRTIQQIAWEAGPSLEAPERQGLLCAESEILRKTPGEQKSVKGTMSSVPGSTDSASFGTDTEYVSLEDLAPLAMDKIEALSIEGLKIQSGMSYVDVPSNVAAQSIDGFSTLKGKNLEAGGSIGLDGTGGLQLLDIKDNNGEDVDGLMGLSLTLDEWMRFDSGEIDDDDLVTERTCKILAAHRATSLDAFRQKPKGQKRRGGKYGLLGSKFTVALMVQLRDPLRNYEPVGTPMLSLIQAERVFFPPKTKIYGAVPPVGNIDEDDTEIAGKYCVEDPKEDKMIHEKVITGYKITEVHVAGLKVESSRYKLWGSANQQKSGSRWLLANGMGKKNKHPLMKSKPVVKNSGRPATITVQPGDTLWSISSRVHGTGDKWKDLAALNPHIRNPDVIFPNETIRLR